MTRKSITETAICAHGVRPWRRWFLWTVQVLLVLLWFGLLACSLLSLGVLTSDPSMESYVDGFGRSKWAAPELARFWLLGSEYWSGWGWLMIDLQIFFLVLAAIAIGVRWISHTRDKIEDEQHAALGPVADSHHFDFPLEVKPPSLTRDWVED